ncbi:MAG: site-2 protease family protein [Candidatus Micrarchaeota archaeon]
MQFHWMEILHIVVSVITISIAFSLFNANFWLVLLTLGLGFILHELSHKIVAQMYGATAYYRAWTFGLLLAVALALFTQGGFVFAAPGAVVIYGAHLTRGQNGRIALAGPMMNFFLALAFLFLAATNSGLRELGFAGAYVNAFLGAFNMIPVYPLDGEKVQSWSYKAWGIASLLLFGLMFAFMFGFIRMA